MGKIRHTKTFINIFYNNKACLRLFTLSNFLLELKKDMNESGYWNEVYLVPISKLERVYLMASIVIAILFGIDEEKNEFKKYLWLKEDIDKDIIINELFLIEKLNLFNF
jgi:hypothetical protein